ncbi:MAG: hypothetical protein ACP5KA_05945 [Desulfurococcaceae archaeon]
MLENLKTYLSDYVSKRVPGFLSLLNVICTTRYGKDCLSLFFESPSRLYLVFLAYYRGDALSADYAFTIAVLSPIALLARDPGLAGKLLELVKLGRDPDFLDLLTKLSDPRSSRLKH